MIITSLFSLAAAGPLADVARIELDNAREIHRAVRAAEVSQRYKLSEGCREAHGKAEAVITKARALYDDSKHRAAYEGVHTALVTLKPCTIELANGPTSYQARMKGVLRTSDEQLTALDAHLKDHGTDASKTAYGDAVAAKTTSRGKALADQMTPAVEDWYTMLEAVYAAVKASS